MDAWWETFFDDTFANLLLERIDTPKFSQTISFLTDHLNLKSGNVLFDQCCGSGDISVALGKKNITMIGVDQCKEYILKARKKSFDENLSCTFHVGDAYSFVPQALCDAVINWYTSFGYSESDEQNKKMLVSAYKALKNNGFFILDYNNPAYIFKNFKAHETHEICVNNRDGVLLKKSKVDFRRGMFISNWTYTFENQKTETKIGESKIYFASDIKSMLESVGFTDIQFFGDINSGPLTLNSPRCITLAKKP